MPDVNTTTSPYRKFLWNSGSTVHVVKDTSFLHDFVPGNYRLRAANKTYLLATGIGVFKGILADGTQMTLSKVFCCPEVVMNILSPNCIDKFQILRFRADLVKFDNVAHTFDMNRPIGQVVGGHQVLDILVNFSSDLPVQAVADKLPLGFSLAVSVDEEDQYALSDYDSLDEEMDDLSSGERSLGKSTLDRTDAERKAVRWHNNLGHPPADRLRHFKRVHPGLEGVSPVPLKDCPPCHLGRQTDEHPRLSAGRTVVRGPFRLLHADLCGPIFTPIGCDGSKHFLVVVDRHARFFTFHLL